MQCLARADTNRWPDDFAVIPTCLESIIRIFVIDDVEMEVAESRRALWWLDKRGSFDAQLVSRVNHHPDHAHNGHDTDAYLLLGHFSIGLSQSNKLFVLARQL